MMAHERDLRKLRYCFERRIPLVCIPFGMSETTGKGLYFGTD